MQLHTHKQSKQLWSKKKVTTSCLKFIINTANNHVKADIRYHEAEIQNLIVPDKIKGKCKVKVHLHRKKLGKSKCVPEIKTTLQCVRDRKSINGNTILERNNINKRAKNTKQY